MSSAGVTWVLQYGIGERDRLRLEAAIDALGLRREVVKVVPFSHEAAGPLPRIDGPCIVYGSGGLLTLARRQGWRPGGWDGDEFSASRVSEALGVLALNHGAIVAQWSGLVEAARSLGTARVFARPDAETKEFPGGVLELDEFDAWVQRLRAVGYGEGSQGAVLVAPARRLGREWRLFVAEGEPVASAQYAREGEPEQGPAAPDEVLSFARRALDRHCPAPALALDIAETWTGAGWELRVVELNSINSAGFHGCDPGPIVSALSKLAARAG